MTVDPTRLREIAAEAGERGVRKNAVYGEAFRVAGECMAKIFPNGIPPGEDAMIRAGLISRTLEKLAREGHSITIGERDEMGEIPWLDIIGNGLLGVAHEESRFGAPTWDGEDVPEWTPVSTEMVACTECPTLMPVGFKGPCPGSVANQDPPEGAPEGLCGVVDEYGPCVREAGHTGVHWNRSGLEWPKASKSNLACDAVSCCGPCVAEEGHTSPWHYAACGCAWKGNGDVTVSPTYPNPGGYEWPGRTPPPHDRVPKSTCPLPGCTLLEGHEPPHNVHERRLEVKA